MLLVKKNNSHKTCANSYNQSSLIKLHRGFNILNMCLDIFKFLFVFIIHLCNIKQQLETNLNSNYALTLI